jgi:N-acylglucosamine 2-epimerase
MQGRCAWTFSYLCRQYGIRQEWLNTAKSCLEFLEKYCVNRQKGNRMYFTVTADGKPLRQRRYNFSESFYILGNAEYAALTGDEACMQRARDAYELVWRLNRGLIDDPVGLGAKTIPQTRSCRGLADPMIYLNTSEVMLRCDPDNAGLYAERAQQSVEDILRYHHKPELRCTLETVELDGKFMPEITAGRVVNPGHAIECSWFMMEYANRTGDTGVADKAREIFDFAVSMGWDEEYEGLLYYVDCLGKPTMPPVKGSAFKGLFHLPRMLIMVDKMLEEF